MSRDTLTAPQPESTSSRMPQDMTPRQFREGIEKTLSITQKDFARIIGVADKTVHRACADDGDGPSPPMAFALRSLMRNHITPLTNGASYDFARVDIARRLIAIAEDAHRAGWGWDVAAEIILDKAINLKPQLERKEREG